MRVPHTLCPQTFAVYCPEEQDDTNRAHDVINAADTIWDIKSPASLERLVIRALATNIEAWCPWLLQALGPDHLSVVLEELSLNLPLSFCIRNVPDGFYWQRRALATWPGPEQGVCDVARHGHSWRRLVLERHVQSLLERALPRSELQYVLRTQLRDAAPHVRTIELREMQASAVGEQQHPVHLPLGLVLPLVPALEELKIRIGPRECGLSFAWSKFTLSPADATSLGHGLWLCSSLVILRICSSHVTDETLDFLLFPKPVKAKNEDDNENGEEEEEAEIPVGNLAPMLPNLVQLDLSHNDLQDAAAETLAKFLCAHPALVHLRLVNNKIGSRGAEVLASSLENCKLQELDLSLNLLWDDGGIALGKNCMQLHRLRLGGCGLGLATAQAFAASLSDGALQTLDLSNNNLSQDAGVVFINILKKTKITLQEIDLRMTGVKEDDRQLIIEILRHSQT